MIAQRLRQLDRQQLSWSLQIKRWQAQGALIVRCAPLAQSQLLHFRTDSGWEGMVDLYEWASNVMPEQTQLAPQFLSVDRLETLFTHATRPFESGLNELEFQKIISHERIYDETYTQQARYALLTGQGKIWLIKPAGGAVKAPFREAASLNLGHLPLSLLFTLGHSKISLTTLKKSRRGDILLISHPESYVTLDAKKIAHYRIIEDQIVIEEYEESEFFSTDEDDGFLSEEMQEGAEQMPKLCSREKLPIHLSFTLEQRKVTVAELEELYQGACLTCLPQAEKNVIVRANGMPLAKGELVWIEDRMGVEITMLYNEAGHGK